MVLSWRAKELIAALKQCSKMRDLETGKRIHKEARAQGVDTNILVSNTLIQMYGKCRSMELASQIFRNMTRKDVVTWTCLILGYVENGQGFLALDLFTSMDCQPDHVTFVAALKACASLSGGKHPERRLALEKGKAVHELIKLRGFQAREESLIACSLVDMYGKLGDMDRARKVFDRMERKDVVAWTCLILGYVENEDSFKALETFKKMDYQPNHLTFFAALKACGSLAKQKNSDVVEVVSYLHRQLTDLGHDSNTLVGNTLVETYSKLGETPKAFQAFNSIKTKDTVSWNALIQGYVENGDFETALNVFFSMDCEPSPVTYISGLKACAGLASMRRSSNNMQDILEKGICIHTQIKPCDLEGNNSLATTLLDMYSKCRKMDLAKEVFESMSIKDAVSWTCLILGYVKNGQSQIALDLFTEMDCQSDEVTCIAALKACTALAGEGKFRKDAILEKGIAIHNAMSGRGNIYQDDISLNGVVTSCLVDMYSKCGDMQRAREVFERLPHKDVVLWSCLLLGYVDNGESLTALELFDRMDCEPNQVTFVAVVKACARLAGETRLEKNVVLDKGRQLHRLMKEQGMHRDVVVASSLVDMYSKCGELRLAREAFDSIEHKDSVAWTCIIQGYVDNAENSTALELFARMDCEPNVVTCLAAVKACGNLAVSEKSLEKGLGIHQVIKKLGLDSDIAIASALVDMYSKYGEMELARDVFERISSKDAVLWNSLMLGYVENDQSSVALDLFSSMDCEPTTVTYISALKACGRVASLPAGREIHGRVIKLGLEGDNMLIVNALVDFYSRCGCMRASEDVFNAMYSRELPSWNALIAGYSSLGEISQVFRLADELADAGLKMDGTTFVNILTACSHAGMVRQGEMLFQCMEKHGVVPTQEHFCCMVDMLGRANRFKEAVSMVENMPFDANEVTWMALLSACRQWKNVEVGKVAFHGLMSGKRKDESAAYVIMSDMHNVC